MFDKPCVVQFLHSGKQYDIKYIKTNKKDKEYKFFTNNSVLGIKYWNSSLHKRKYIRSLGDYIDCNENYTKSKLIDFWGEWESHSTFELLNNSIGNHEIPHHIHVPFFSKEHNGTQNTDPFVFGDCFLYSCCQQSNIKLRNLPVGSLILFGSEIGNKEELKFVLDTVFVIQDRIEISKVNLNIIKQRTNQIFVDSVLRKISLKDKTLYFSQTYGQVESEMFSFFPCIKSQTDKYIIRPSLDWQKYNLKKPGAYQGTYFIPDASPIEYWRSIKDELLEGVWDLGVKAYLPENINITQIFGQDFV